MTPVIGITAYDDEAAWRNWKGRAASRPYAYVNAVRRGGGRPVLLPPGGDEAEARATVAGLDGLIVAGGPDIHPGRYGRGRHPRHPARVTRGPRRPSRSGTPGTWPSPAPRSPRACRCWLSAAACRR